VGIKEKKSCVSSAYMCKDSDGRCGVDVMMLDAV